MIGQPRISELAVSNLHADALRDLACSAADVVDRDGAVLIRIGMLRLDEHTSRKLARDIVSFLHDELRRRGLPDASYLEYDDVQGSRVAENATTRTLLPHYDGGHASYLTPSVLQDQAWDPAMRTFSDKGFTTTAAHKMYQGVFIADPGNALSVTTYYPWVAILRDAFSVREGQPARDATELAAWVGTNLQGAFARRGRHECRYPSWSAMLGLEWPEVEPISLHYADVPLDDPSRDVGTDLINLLACCPCGSCPGETTRLACHITSRALELPWPEFRRRYERWACSERCDLVFGNNLTMMHGGLCGGPTRTIEPMCLVVDRPVGNEYESWLARVWEDALSNAH